MDGWLSDDGYLNPHQPGIDGVGGSTLSVLDGTLEGGGPRKKLTEVIENHSGLSENIDAILDGLSRMDLGGDFQDERVRSAYRDIHNKILEALDSSDPAVRAEAIQLRDFFDSDAGGNTWDSLYNPEDYQTQLDLQERTSAIDLQAGGGFLKPSKTPLVLDLDGDGVELISLENSTAFFDFEVDGYAQNTGWVSADDALLALDLDGDGVIDDGSELFGDQTGQANGFLALAEHDSNDDGLIDANDAVFSDLVVWQDLNGDGYSDAGEMFSLSDAGITSIDLGYTDVNETNEGHSVLQSSTVTFADGSIHDIDDVYFENDPRSSIALLPDDFQYHTDVFKLPALFGYGHIASTWVVLSQDADLRTDAEALVTQLANGDVAGFEIAFEAFLFAWAGVEDVDPTSRGPAIQAQKLAFLEKAYGTDFDMGNAYGANPGPVASLEIAAQFDELVSKLAARFIAQSAISDALLTATDQSEFDATLAEHPFTALSSLIANYSPSKRSVEAENYDWVSDIVELAFGTDPTLTMENMQTVLQLLSVDLDDDVAFRTAIENAYLNAGGNAADATSFADSVLQETTLYVNDTTGDDTITGDAGDNVLVGRQGNDTYVWGTGMGNDVIDEENGLSGEIDRLVLTNLNRSDIRFVKMTEGGFEQDLKIEVIATGEWLILDDQLGWTSGNSVEKIEFADGTVLTDTEFEAEAYVWIEMDAPLDDFTFSLGNEYDLQITSATGEVTLLSNFLATHDGGDIALSFIDGTSLDAAGIRAKWVADQKESGFVRGSKYGDDYSHNTGDGSYTIQETGSGHDTFVFSELNAGEVLFSHNAGGDLVMTMTNGEVVTVTDHFSNSGYEGIETITFADGTSLDAAGIRAKSVVDQKESGFVRGSKYGDDYSHNTGDGSYTIQETGSGHDTFVFSELNAGEVLFSHNAGGDLVMTMTNGEVVTVTDHFSNSGYEGIETITFADGTSLDAAGIRAKSVVDQKESGFVRGSKYGDDYSHNTGDGSYTIQETGSGHDTFVFSELNAGEVLFSHNAGGDLVMTMTNGEVVTVTDHFSNSGYEGIETITFADGTSLDAAGIRAKSVVDQKESGFVRGSKYGDDYSHNTGDGSYTIQETGSGHDTFVFSELNADEVLFSHNAGGDLVMTMTNGEVVTVTDHFSNSGYESIETITFADGTSLDAAGIDQKVADDLAFI